MSNSVYYKATDEDGNTVLRHSWKKHKYLYIKNGKYVYPEDVKKSSVPYKGPTSAMQAQKAQHEKDFQKRVRAMNAHTVAKKNADMVRKKQNAQHEKDFQKRVRAMNAHTVAKKNADMVRKKQIAANVKKQNAPSTKVKKAANFAKKVATRDAVAKTVAARYLLDKASKSPTANAAKAKARSVVSKGEYKLERAGQKLARDVKKTSAYKKARKATSTARSRAMTPAEARNKAEYKIERAGQKLANDAKPYATSVKKNVNKAYKSAKKEYNRVSRDASKAYKSAKKKAKKVSRSFNKAKRAGKAYLDYLTK